MKQPDSTAGTRTRTDRHRFTGDPRLPWLECRYSIDSDKTFKAHMHRRFCIGGVARGTVECRVDTAQFLLGSGSLVCINPEVLHCCNDTEHGRRDFFMLYLSIDWCLLVQQSVWDVSTFVPVETVRLDDQNQYLRFLRLMDLVMDPDEQAGSKEEALAEFMAELFCRLCRERSPVRPFSADIDAMKRLLAADLQQELNLADLAEQFGANPYTLLRRFKAETGLTPHAYRMNCRVENARRLLQHGWDIGDAALASGFFDQSHLHRQFRAMTTVTPGEYRVNFVQ